MKLKIWRLNPNGIKVIPAEKTLGGKAHPEALKWCGPYTSANKYGFWVYPPVDVDIVWRGDGFEHKILSEWKDDEISLIRSLTKSADQETKSFTSNFNGRAKIDFGRVEPNICQVWTGVSFETPPGWVLLIRSPININMDAPYRIQEGILETDWMRYDIWINVAVQQKDVVVKIRKNQILAQLVPLQRECYDKQWELEEEIFNRDTGESEKAFLDWADYNYKKYVRMMHEKEKDSATYHKERNRKLAELSPKAVPKRLISRKTE